MRRCPTIRARSCRCPSRSRTRSGPARPQTQARRPGHAAPRLRAFDGRRVLYTWIGGTRRDWRGQGHFRALTEQQELWAIEQGFDEIVVKTKNKFYDMRGTLDHLRFEVVKYERNVADNAESKVYLSKKLSAGGPRRAPQRQDGRAGAGIAMGPTTLHAGSGRSRAARRRCARASIASGDADARLDAPPNSSARYAPGKWTARQILIASCADRAGARHACADGAVDAGLRRAAVRPGRLGAAAKPR